jgi:hypothetical protein
VDAAACADFDDDAGVDVDADADAEAVAAPPVAGLAVPAFTAFTDKVTVYYDRRNWSRNSGQIIATISTTKLDTASNTNFGANIAQTMR